MWYNTSWLILVVNKRNYKEYRRMHYLSRFLALQVLLLYCLWPVTHICSILRRSPVLLEGQLIPFAKGSILVPWHFSPVDLITPNPRNPNLWIANINLLLLKSVLWSLWLVNASSEQRLRLTPIVSFRFGYDSLFAGISF